MAIIQSGATADLWTIDPISNAGRVTLYDADGNAINGIGTIPVNGTLTALNQTLEIELTGQANTSVQLYGTTGTLTVSFQATINDGYSWFSVNAFSLSTDTPVTATSGDGVWFIDVSGYHGVRLLVTSYTSGSTNAVMIAAPEERSVRSVSFLGFADNSTNSTNKTPVLAARANISAPTWTDGNQVPLSVDTSGNLRITGTITATSASTSTTGSSPPASATYIGGSVTTAAPSYTNATMNALSLTLAGALRVDGSGVTQPISAASLPLPTGAATETTLGSRLADSTFTGRINTLGQKTMANSTPVVLASDQSAIPVSQSGSWTVTSNIGTTNGLALDATLTGGTQTTRITDGTNTATVKAASTPAVAADKALVVTLSPNNPVVSNADGYVTTVAPAYTNNTFQSLSLTTVGALRVDGSAVTQPISAVSLPLPTGAATETTLAGVLTTTAFQARINTLGQKTMANSTPVVLASDQTVIPVSDNGGSLTVDGTVSISGTVTTQDTTSLVDNAGFTDGTSRVLPAGYILDETAGTALTENDIAAARVDSKRAQVIVIEDATTRGQRLTITASNAMKVDGSAVTQPISAASLPLPTGAATETTLGSRLADSTFTGRINTLGQKTMANSTPVVLASDQTVIPVSQSGTWTVQPGNTANTTPWLTTINQGGNSATVTASNALKVDGSAVTQPISGTVTANAGTGTFTVGQATAANLNATVVGTGTDNTTNSTTKIPVLPARANTSAPTWTDGNMVPLSTDTSGNLRVTGSVVVDKSTTGTITSVVGSTSNTSILASNTNRISATVYNESNKTMYLALASTASTSSYTIQIARDSYWELPVTYTGAISAVWASGVSGNALVTELT